MSVSVEDVRHVARLAELAVDDADLPALTAQLDRIVGFVAQLADAGPTAADLTFQPGPDHTPLRADVVNPVPLARPPAAFAPEFIDGFFVVPKLGVLDEP